MGSVRDLVPWPADEVNWKPKTTSGIHCPRRAEDDRQSAACAVLIKGTPRAKGPFGMAAGELRRLLNYNCPAGVTVGFDIYRTDCCGTGG